MPSIAEKFGFHNLIHLQQMGWETGISSDTNTTSLAGKDTFLQHQEDSWMLEEGLGEICVPGWWLLDEIHLSLANKTAQNDYFPNLSIPAGLTEYSVKITSHEKNLKKGAGEAVIK